MTPFFKCDHMQHVSECPAHLGMPGLLQDTNIDPQGLAHVACLEYLAHSGMPALLQDTNVDPQGLVHVACLKYP
eukprot:c37136_g1_i1 orf=2-220(-)